MANKGGGRIHLWCFFWKKAKEQDTVALIALKRSNQKSRIERVYFSRLPLIALHSSTSCPTRGKYCSYSYGSELVSSLNCDYDVSYKIIQKIHPPRLSFPQNSHFNLRRIQRSTERKAGRNHIERVCLVYLRHISSYQRGLCGKCCLSSCILLRLQGFQLWQPSLAQEFGTLLVEPEKQNLLDLDGSQSRAEVANDQLQGGKHHLSGRGKKKMKNEYMLQNVLLLLNPKYIA